ncbi:MazG family protein [Nocardioides marmorisolisilvae]|uniref:MazG family protein n=1 Tax=Nocardioides marmorisolisilvae TaxID=1542737 RepID=UPI001618A423|nr:MazG family protein [Nocardioides marmorisolisilvae]
MAESELDELAGVMARLRRECAWKANQTHESLTRYLLEETYEVVEAIESGDPAHLREELGDLLLQVYFHAAIAAEDGQYDINDVAGDLIAKLVRRNPHVFAPEQATADPDDAAGIDAQWERIKADEKQRSSLMEGVPDELPALLRAVKAVERLERGGTAVRVPDGDGVGDQLLALAVRAQREGLDPEQELRTAIRRLIEPR